MKNHFAALQWVICTYQAYWYYNVTTITFAKLCKASPRHVLSHARVARRRDSTKVYECFLAYDLLYIDAWLTKVWLTISMSCWPIGYMEAPLQIQQKPIKIHNIISATDTKVPNAIFQDLRWIVDEALQQMTFKKRDFAKMSFDHLIRPQNLHVLESWSIASRFQHQKNSSDS